MTFGILLITFDSAVILFCIYQMVRISRQIRRLKRASSLLDRLQPIIEHGIGVKEFREIMELLHGVPSDFALMIVEEKIDKYERAIKQYG